MIESEIDYRGSKSKAGTGLILIETAYNKIKLLFTFVKEQRVDGGCTGFPVLRCTLMGFERNYQKRILSKSINKFTEFKSLYNNNRVRALYSKSLPIIYGYTSSYSFSTLGNSLYYSSPPLREKNPQNSFASSMDKKENKLSPSFIAGFIDGEGCFSITLVKDKSYKLGWQVKPKFSIGLHKKDRGLLENVRSSLGLGGISVQGVNGVQFYVNSVKDRRVLIDFLDKYPLLTKKGADYLIFKTVVELMENKAHLTQEGLQKIVALKGILNTGFISKDLQAAFSDLCSVELDKSTLTSSSKTLDSEWLAGFTSAEGSFLVRSSNSPGRTLNTKVQLEFNLTQHMRDEQLMKDIAKFFGCGSVYLNREAYVYRVVGLSNIVEKIIPFFINYPILGIKALDFQDFIEVAELLKENKHLTPEGVEKIQLIKAGMNSARSI